MRDLEEAIDRVYRHVGAELRRARLSARMTQAQVAEQVGMTRSSIANVEAGRQRVPLHLLVQMSSILGVEAGTLLPSSSGFGHPGRLPDVSKALEDQPDSTRDFVQGAIAKLAMPAIGTKQS